MTNYPFIHIEILCVYEETIRFELKQEFSYS